MGLGRVLTWYINIYIYVNINTYIYICIAAALSSWFLFLEAFVGFNFTILPTCRLQRRCTQAWTSWRRRSWPLSAQSLFRLSGMWRSLRRGRAWRWSRRSGTRNRMWNRWGTRQPSDGEWNLRRIWAGWFTRAGMCLALLLIYRPAPVSAIFSMQRVTVNRSQWSLRLILKDYNEYWTHWFAHGRYMAIA